MPYCATTFQTIPPERVENVLTSLSQRCFIGGQAAYELCDGSYAIDAGENDIRAYYEEDEKTLKFFCRYERDMKFYDKKLMAFANKHGIDTNLLNVKY